MGRAREITQRPKQSCPCDQLLPESGVESPHSPALQAIRLERKSPVHRTAPAQQSLVNTGQRSDAIQACTGHKLGCQLLKKPATHEEMETRANGQVEGSCRRRGLGARQGGGGPGRGRGFGGRRRRRQGSRMLQRELPKCPCPNQGRQQEDAAWGICFCLLNFRKV